MDTYRKVSDTLVEITTDVPEQVIPARTEVQIRDVVRMTERKKRLLASIAMQQAEVDKIDTHLAASKAQGVEPKVEPTPQ